MVRLKKMSWLTAGFVAMGMMLGSAYAAAPAAGADEAAIRGQTTSWIKSFNAGDAKAVGAGYAEDAILLPPGAPAAVGRTAIQASLAKEMAGAKAGGAVFGINPKTDVGVSGDMGWESGAYTITVKGAVVETGKFLSVSRKRDGKWLYIRDTWNADASPAPPAAPVAPAPAKAPAAPSAPTAPPAPKK